MPFETGGADLADGGRVVIAHLAFPATFDAVRAALAALMYGPVMSAVPDDDRSAAELVLAEVMNNIVEHAYVGKSGEITLTLWQAGGEVACRITDRGSGMPADVLPDGALRVPDATGNLPEGGFGWFLIRSLSHDLRYARYGTLNELTFVLGGEQSGPVDAAVSAL